MTVELLAGFEPPAPFEPPAWVAGELARPTGRGITVAVVDSGWDRACNDPRVLAGVGLVDPDDDFALKENDDDHDRLGHGTACIHQVLRIAPDARVIPIRVFGNHLETSPHTLYTAIRIAVDRGADIVNLSLGTRLEGTLRNLYSACEYARQKGVIVVAAGDNSRQWSYPAIFENVIGVSAARFGSPYEYRYLVDEAHECQAWGIEQPVVWLNGEEQVKHGTSFAAPNISGIVALFLERHPGATLEQVRELLSRFAMEIVPATDDEAEEEDPLAAMLTMGQRDAGLVRHPGTHKLASAERADAAPAKKPAAKKAAAKTSAGKEAAPARSAAKGGKSAPASSSAAGTPRGKASTPGDPGDASAAAPAAPRKRRAASPAKSAAEPAMPAKTGDAAASATPARGRTTKQD